MGFLNIPPPQGFDLGQGLSIITGPASPRFAPPQGSKPVVSKEADVAYVFGTERGSVAYVIGPGKGKEDYELTV